MHVFFLILVHLLFFTSKSIEMHKIIIRFKYFLFQKVSYKNRTHINMDRFHIKKIMGKPLVDFLSV
ncbi:hypothetical protein C1646_713627, partial [Rhizophagus diaphanus]